MADLYELLGVPRDAGKGVIRRAYRSASKHLHPDGGGSREKFEELKLAHDVLTDDDRRARYDRIGSYESSVPDNTRGMAMSLISRAMDGALSDILSLGKRPSEVDFVATVRRKMTARAGEIKKQLSQNDTGSTMLTDVLTRCGSPDDVFSTLIRGKLDVIKQGSDQLRAEAELLESAAILIKDQKFQREVQQVVMGDPAVITTYFFVPG